MAKYESHVTFSAIIGVTYAVAGLYIFDIFYEHAVLSLAIIIIAGLLPDIDHKNGTPAKEVGSLIAAITPIVLLEYFPGLKAGGMARMALVVITCYLITRMFVVRILHMTADRGMVHSIPASIIIFELTYLLFSDLYWYDRVYIATAAFVGFVSHLLLDASGNLDLLGAAMGSDAKKKPVLKVAAPTWGLTVTIYIVVIALGWIIFRDAYPNLAVEPKLEITDK